MQVPIKFAPNLALSASVRQRVWARERKRSRSGAKEKGFSFSPRSPRNRPPIRQRILGDPPEGVAAVVRRVGSICRGFAVLGFGARRGAFRCQSSPSGNEPADRRKTWGLDARQPRFSLRMEGGGCLGTLSLVLVSLFSVYRLSPFTPLAYCFTISDNSVV